MYQGGGPHPSIAFDMGLAPTHACCSACLYYGAASQRLPACAGKKMVLRVRKRPGMEADDVLAPPPAASGSSVWGKLLGGGSKTQDGVQMRLAVRLRAGFRVGLNVRSSCGSFQIGGACCGRVRTVHHTAGSGGVGVLCGASSVDVWHIRGVLAWISLSELRGKSRQVGVLCRCFLAHTQQVAQAVALQVMSDPLRADLRLRLTRCFLTLQT